jgi:hypothetical protein
MNLITAILIIAGTILAMSDGPMFPAINLLGVACIVSVALLEVR